MFSKAVFISYRREVSRFDAHSLYQGLEKRGINAFFDIKIGDSGWRKNIEREIRKRPYFLLVVGTGTLKRCAEEGDILRWEIELAIKYKRKMFLLYSPTFSFEDIKTYLPITTATIVKDKQGFKWPDEPEEREFRFDDLKKRILKPVFIPQQAALVGCVFVILVILTAGFLAVINNNQGGITRTLTPSTTATATNTTTYTPTLTPSRPPSATSTATNTSTSMPTLPPSITNTSTNPPPTTEAVSLCTANRTVAILANSTVTATPVFLRQSPDGTQVAFATYSVQQPGTRLILLDDVPVTINGQVWCKVRLEAPNFSATVGWVEQHSLMTAVPATATREYIPATIAPFIPSPTSGQGANPPSLATPTNTMRPTTLPNTPITRTATLRATTVPNTPKTP